MTHTRSRNGLAKNGWAKKRMGQNCFGQNWFWPKLPGQKHDWPKMDWPKLDWPKSVPSLSTTLSSHSTSTSLMELTQESRSHNSSALEPESCSGSKASILNFLKPMFPCHPHPWPQLQPGARFSPHQTNPKLVSSSAKVSVQRELHQTSTSTVVPLLQTNGSSSTSTMVISRSKLSMWVANAFRQHWIRGLPIQIPGVPTG